MSLGCAIDDGHAYYQHNIVTRENKRTQQDCAAFAASTAGAHYWTWMKSTGRCFVKNSNAIKNRKPNANFVSGSTKCGKQISVGKSKTKHRHRRNVMSYRFKSLLIKKFLNYFHFFDYITQCILSAKFWCLTGWTNIAPRNFILSLRCIAFRICKVCYRRKSTVSPGKFFLSKNNP